MVAFLQDSRFLNSARLQRIIEIAGSALERLRPLTFLDRLQQVNASDDELMGRFTARVIAADIIADGQEALVHEAGQIEIVTTQLPNIKTGQNLTQGQLNLLERLQTGAARAAEEDAAFDWEQRIGENVIQEVRERENQLACAMMLDTLTYSRWGVQVSASWGMPASLKVTVGALWSPDGGATVNVNATPFTDIFSMDVVDANNFGLGPFDRVTMAGRTFDIMTSTNEFAAKAAPILGLAFQATPAALRTLDRPEMMAITKRAFGKEIIIDEKIIREVHADGTTTTSRVLPLNKVLLDRTSNGPREWDMGNGVVTESLVASLTGGTVLGDNPRMMSGAAYGPLGYYTAQTQDLNPPGINAWGVARAFPRRHVVECSAVLTVF